MEEVRNTKVYKARYTVSRDGMPAVSIPCSPIKYHVECYKGKKLVSFLTRNSISEAQHDAKVFVNVAV